MGKLTKSITKSEFINMIGMDTYIHSFKTQIWNVGLVEVSSCSNSKYYSIVWIKWQKYLSFNFCPKGVE